MDKSDDLWESSIDNDQYLEFFYLKGRLKKRLCEDKNLISHARHNQWKDRRDKGYKRNANIFDFIEKVYEPWLGKGLMQSDLRVLDFSLWQALQNKLRTTAIPSHICLPKEADAYLAQAENDEERAMLLAARKWNRYRMRRTRRQNPSP